MTSQSCQVLENRKVAPDHYVLRLASKPIAQKAAPGQFVQLLCSDSYEPLLPRPFSFLTASATDFSLLYQVVGKGTQLLSKVEKGQSLRVLGPLGNGFTLPRMPDDLILVGGGVGIPPLYHLAQKILKSKLKILPKKIHVFLGARHKELLLCEKEFQNLGVTLKVATDDGSKGKKGFITEILEEFLNTRHSGKTPVYTCGPTPMLKAVSAICMKHGAPCEVSVEVPMACGFGACLGCAVKVKGSAKGEHRFAIACVEGPVFQGEELRWD
mgnify:CR=1 FL=1